MKRCKLFLIETLAVSGLLFCAAAQADYGYYHYSTLDGPATDTDGDYYLSWYVIPTDPNAQYDTVEVAYLETRMNGAGTWQQVQEWNNVPIYAAYDDVHRTGQAVGTHNYHMIFLIYSPYTGYDVLEDYWNVTVPAPPSDPGISTPPTEVTSGLAVGTTPYGMDTAGNGDAVVNVPLELIPGVAGFKPELSIVYNSGRGVERLEGGRRLPEDSIGYGWRLAGMSQIRRCVVGQTSSASIQLNSSDSICLDGMPLVKISGTHWSPGAIYRTQIESYTKVEIKGSSGSLWFEVTYPDGAVLQYGNDTSNGSRVDKSGGTDYQWSVNKATSADGNIITYTYEHDADNGINYPLTIEYDEAEVEFGYLERSDTSAVSIGAANQTQSVFLHTVRVIMDSKTVREYRLLHEDVGGNTRLNKIQQCGYDTSGTTPTCMKPLDVDWNSSALSPTMAGVEILVTKVTNGLGADNQFAYGTVVQGTTPAFGFTAHPFDSQSASAPGGTQALSGSAGAALRHVVTQLRRNNGVGGYYDTDYAYLGVGLKSTYHWGFLGFFAQQATDGENGIVTYAQFRMDYPYFGQVARLYQFDDVQGSYSEVLTRIETEYANEDTVGDAVLPYVKRTTNFIYEGGTQLGVQESKNTPTFSSGLITELYNTAITASGASASGSYSVWGDVKSYTLSGVVHSVETTSGFYNRTSPWLIGFVDEVTTESWDGVISSGTAIVQGTTFSADTASLKVAGMTHFPEEAFGGFNQTLITGYTYDSAGRMTQIDVSGDGIASRTTSVNTFHAERTPLNFVNPLSQTASATGCDLRFCKYTSVNDINSESRSALYDVFGRTVSATNSDNVTTTTTFNASPGVSVNGVAAVYRIDTDSPISPKTRTYHDKLGRVIRTETESFSGAYSMKDTWYDDQGRVQRQSLPYLSGGTVYYAIYTYEPLRGRVTNIARADGGSTGIAYTQSSGKAIVTITETVKNSAGTSTVDTQVKVNEYNILGQLVKTTDADGDTEEAWTTYDYDANGNLLSATTDGSSVSASTVTMTYDAAGNQLTVNDPNTGVVTYTYTALGEVKTITDAMSQTTTFTYDKLGRLTQRDNPDGTHTWAWDPTNGKGKLGSKSTGGDFTETYSYNSSKRLSSIVTGIKAIGAGSLTNFTTSYTYDSYGRVATKTHPNGTTITQVYNSYGYLSQLKSGASVYQAFNSADAFGNITSETYVNGVNTTRSFDAKSGRLTAIDTTKSSTVIQNLDYAWRSNGILESRLNTVGSETRKETFQYDAHNRLTLAETFINSTNTRDLSYVYDQLGNLTSKQSSLSGDLDVVSYAYGAGAAGPHAVTSATIGGVGHTLTYDANGAITKYDIAGTTDDKYIKYNAANQPTKIVIGTSLSDLNPVARDEFLYDTDGNRIYKHTVWEEGGVTYEEKTFYARTVESTTYVNDPFLQALIKTRIGKNIMVVLSVDHSINVAYDVEFAHRDHLGSIEKVTNQDGTVLRTMAHEPFGMRKSPTWQKNITASERNTLLYNLFIPDYYYTGVHFASPREARGFTGHEHLDRTGFIHMNGRVYDPQLGRFLSPDPIVQAPTNTQNWNRYSYVLNSPMSFTDPSGYATMGVCHPSGIIGDVETDCPPGTTFVEFLSEDDAPVDVIVNGSSIGSSGGSWGGISHPPSIFDSQYTPPVGYDMGGAVITDIEVRAPRIPEDAQETTVTVSTRRIERLDIYKYSDPSVFADFWVQSIMLAVFKRPVWSATARAANVAHAAKLAKQLGSQEGVAELLRGGGKAIAGAGTNVVLRDVGRLVSQYGGKAGDWAKITSTAPGHLQTHAYRNVVTGWVVELKSILP